MTSFNNERSTTSTEREYLEEILHTSCSRRPWELDSKIAFQIWTAFMFLFVLAWLGLAWVVRRIFHFEIGFQSSAAVSIMCIGAAVCAIYPIVWILHRHNAGGHIQTLLRADLDSGKVIDEHYQFTAAKRFQEPEHGGLIYFLHTIDDKVFTIFDEESQDLGVDDEDPLTSSFKPQSELLMVRAPNTKYVISKQFSGTPLELDPPLALNIDPELWPESDEYCTIPWNELDRHLSVGSKV